MSTNLDTELSKDHQEIKTGGTPENQRPITIITANIGYANRNNTNAVKRNSAIASLLQNKNPAIIFVQESDFKTFNNSEYWNVKIPDKYKAKIQKEVKFIYNSEETELTDVDVGEILTVNDQLQRRYKTSNLKAFMVKAEPVDKSKPKFLCVSWHGQHRTNDETKQNDLTLLINIVTMVSEKEKLPVIIGGDFNVPFSAIEYVLEDTDPSYVVYNYKPSRRRCFKKTIDFFVSSSTLTLKGIAPVDWGEDANKLLDHDPIIAELQFNPDKNEQDETISIEEEHEMTYSVIEDSFKKLTIQNINSMISKETTQIIEEIKDEVRKNIQEEVKEEIKEEITDKVRKETEKEIKHMVWRETKVKTKEKIEEDIKDEFMAITEFEIKEDIKKEIKDDFMQEVRKAIQEKIIEGIKDEVRKETKEKMKDEVMAKTEVEIQGEINDKFTKKIKEEIKKKTIEEFKDEVKKEAEEDIIKDIKEETKFKLKDEIRKEIQEDVLEEVEKEAVRKEIKEEIKVKIYNEIKKEIKEEISGKINNAIQEEFKRRIKDEIYNEIQKEIKDKTAEEIQKEVKREIEDEISKEIKHEL
uniref:Probable inactive protein kinase DDB_G0270444 n=1 Tax=Crassostrea virginica TaxID=6565 RepID=A0A8B8BQV2_CRAVI|nr:probable inactive protein kinase DDB_G0270444 [Crassostrea virginica]XP_022305296.1 probable inactive protein kinase DDB_G0270444 [Crassostrea virginica]